MIEKDTSSQESAPFRLSSDCRLVSGFKRAAIYDLEQGNVYSLNEPAREIIRGSVDDKFNFWKKLTEMGLAELSSSAAPFELEVKIPQVGLEFMWLFLSILLFLKSMMQLPKHQAALREPLELLK